MHSYRDREAVLSTKHQKLSLIAPSILEHAGLRVSAIEVDTDQLGTFSGEKQRIGSALDTAISKAWLGMAETGQSLGIASEGSIGPDPQNPFLLSDIELVVLVDAEHQLTIFESHRSFDIVAAKKTVQTGEDLTDFLEQIDFPNQGLIAKLEGQPTKEIVKGISSLDQLERALRKLGQESQGLPVTIETDFRAHQSPSRRKNIEIAADKLARRLVNECPACKSPGFGMIRLEYGLNCTGCGQRNDSAVSRELLCCVSCKHQEPGKIIQTSLSPDRCDWCNP
jgi:hypothetical protein